MTTTPTYWDDFDPECTECHGSGTVVADRVGAWADLVPCDCDVTEEEWA